MSLSKTAAAKTQTQFANVGAEEISLSSGLSAYLVCVQIALAKASPKENASAKRKTKFPVEIVKIVFSPPLTTLAFAVAPSPLFFNRLTKSITQTLSQKLNPFGLQLLKCLFNGCNPLFKGFNVSLQLSHPLLHLVKSIKHYQQKNTVHSRI